MHGRVRNNPGQQSFSGQSYGRGNNPQPHQGYVVNAQARSAQQGQPRSSNSNRNHEPIDQFSRRQRHANLPQRRNNRVSDANRYRVSLSTSAGAREDRSDTQRLLPDPQRAGSSREAMAVLAQFVQGVEDRRSSGQLLSATQSPSHPYWWRKYCSFSYRPAGRTAKLSSLERLPRGSNLWPVKLVTVLLTARDRCDISSKKAVLPAGAMPQRWAPQTPYTLRRRTSSIAKILCILQAARVTLSQKFDDLDEL